MRTFVLSHSLALIAALFALTTAEPALAASKKSACQAKDAAQKRLDAFQRTARANLDAGGTPAATHEAEERELRVQLNLKTQECTEATDSFNSAKAECDRKRSGDGNDKLWEWNESTEKCEDSRSASTKSNPNSGDCRDAELFKGGDLRGQKCQEAATIVKDVGAQQEAITGAATSAATVFSTSQAQQATGAQGDAQARQQKIMQALAITKIATGGLALTNAARLKSAASDAEGASSSISEAHRNLSDYCDANARTEQLSSDQCFYKHANRFGVESTEAERANFERMKSASSQSQEQADKANNLAKTAMIQGMADALVGIQAMQLAKQAQNNAQQAGNVPTVYVPPTYQLRSGTAGSYGGFGSTEGGNAPVDFGTTSDGGAGLGVQGGQIRGGMKGAAAWAKNGGGFAPAKSSVTTSGGGGAGGGGGGGGGGGAGGKKGPGKYNTTAGEYSLGGGGGFPAPRAGGAAEKGDGSNAFADALAKLFPQDQAGKPVVDARALAGGDPTEEIYDDAVTGGDEVYAADLSIFEQVTAKYRQLSNNGRL